MSEQLTEKLKSSWRAWPPEIKLRFLSRLERLPSPATTQRVKEVRWCPHKPTAKQGEFLALDCLEAFYGGAAGPGKSDALLMAALQYVHLPRYAAMILRVDYPRLSLAGGLLPRSHEWLANTPVKWNGTDKRWTFPSGASLSFGYLDNPQAKYRYGSSEYQFIGWDELTEFPEESYTFLFSRLRKTRDIPVPLRMRSASNPGGVGHMWVKRRFITDEALKALREGEGGIYWNEGRAFVPGLLQDNPFLDQEEYIKSLSHLDPVTRARLLAGDWEISEAGRIKPHWLRYWEPRGDYYHLYYSEDKPPRVLHPKECQRIITVDCAGSSRDVTREKKGKPPSYSVVSTWDFHRPEGWLIWRDMRRGRWEFPELCQQIESAFEEQKPEWIGVEDEKTGRAALQSLRHLPTKALSHEGKDKLARAGRLLNDMEQGKVFLPRYAAWLSECQAELLTWTGHEDDPFDMGDTAAYAALHVDRIERDGEVVIESIYVPRG